MEQAKTNPADRILKKLFGGLDMTWPAVLVSAVAAAVLTAAILTIPAFNNTSFEQIGVSFEAWILFAVIIMSNCKSPLESSLKTFVFFLVSQPLIYLLQVPFSPLGWQLFEYYRYWFYWTLATIPMAFIGWYITKRNWLSVLIFAPVYLFLGNSIWLYGRDTVRHFPPMLIAALFCILQILLHVHAFFPKKAQKAVGIAIPALMILGMIFLAPQVAFEAYDTLPGEPAFTQEATLTVEDASIADVELTQAEEGRIHIDAHRYGETTLMVSDGEQEHRYTLRIYDDNGVDRAEIKSVP